MGEWVKRSTLRWFVHIERMGNEEFVKKVYSQPSTFAGFTFADSTFAGFLPPPFFFYIWSVALLGHILSLLLLAQPVQDVEVL